MKKLTALVVGAALMMVAGSAFALPTYAPTGSGTAALWLNSGVNNVVVYDNGIGDLDPTLGSIVFLGNIGSTFLDMSVGSSKPNIGSAISPILTLNNTTVTGMGTLNIAFTDTFFGPISAGLGGMSLSTGGTLINSTASVSSLISTTNTPWGGNTLMDLGSFATSSFQAGAQTPLSELTGPVALTLLTSVTVGQGGYSQVTATLQPVPEPGTMVLLGAGLFGLAVYGKRRMNKEA